MARSALIVAVVLWCVCGGYGFLPFKKYPTEYPTEPTEYTTQEYITDTTDVYSDETYQKATHGSAVSERVQFRCVRDGLFGYPQDCTRFIQCSNGYAYFMPCPEGLHFSERAGRCDYPCEAQCNPAISDQCRRKKPNEVCFLPIEKGPCKSHFVRYYYDKRAKKCAKFFYGGCHGNGNNFKSEKECWEVCGKVAHAQESSASYRPVDPWGNDDQPETTDSSWTLETTSDGTDTGTYDVRSETEATEDYLPHSSYEDPQREITSFSEQSEIDPWFVTAEDDPLFSNGSPTVDDQQPSAEPSSELPGFSTEGDSTAYSFKARVMDDFECRGNSSYRNPDDCASFIWCPLDRAIVVPCPPNTHYSPQREACVDPCLAHCNVSLACSCGWPECHQYNHFDCESDVDAGPCSDRELRYYYDRERGRCKSFYYGGCHGNGNNFRTLKECQRECQTSLLAGFRCPSYNGNFGHYPDCVSYYQCKRGNPTLKRCPEGMAFHHLKAKCVPEEEAVCVYECREPNAVYPAPKDCRSYIDCVNDIPKLKKCPRGLAFDINKRNCVLERTTSCHW